MKKTITNDGFDIGEGEIGRIGKLALLWKIIPFGTYGGGPGWKCIAALYFLHTLGRPLWFIATRYEDRLSTLYRRLRGKR